MDTTGRKTRMTTYELPPEPPIGESVQDALGRTWKHEGVNRWKLKSAGYADDPETRSWHRVLLSAPLTLIEPDPWPTEPLIAAEGRLWFRQEDGDYLDKDGTVRGEGRHTFAGPVVPVTVVPTAEWEVLVEKVRSFDAARTDNQWRVVTARAAELLVAATDALGVSND